MALQVNEMTTMIQNAYVRLQSRVNQLRTVFIVIDIGLRRFHGERQLLAA